MSSPTVEQDCYWQEFTQLKLEACYVGDYRNFIRRQETMVATVRAVASSASIGAWVIWKQYAIVWASFIAASQVVDALRDIFPFRKRRQALSSSCNALNRLFVDAQRDWESIASGKVEDAKISVMTHQMRQKMQRCEEKYIPDGLPRREDLFQAAHKEMARFFATRYF